MARRSHPGLRQSQRHGRFVDIVHRLPLPLAQSAGEGRWQQAFGLARRPEDQPATYLDSRLRAEIRGDRFGRKGRDEDDRL
jgi:hypothetical protein